MSELIHNGYVYFDRTLTETEELEITKIFASRSHRFHVNQEVEEDDAKQWNHIPHNAKSYLNFEEYTTGWSGLRAELEELEAYCREKQIGIVLGKSFIEVYGDEEGGYCYCDIDFEGDGHFLYLDRDDLGVINSSSNDIAFWLSVMDRLPEFMTHVPYDILNAEVQRRK